MPATLWCLEGMWLRTRITVWRSLYNFRWEIFAVNFGMGVVPD
ncbi:cytochrome ubiquinol oxidase subunit I [Klebsiella pneumoniae]|nr:cytochrome ubiquinol oxidase subunit I [Klebsiella pneumoniae]